MSKDRMAVFLADKLRKNNPVVRRHIVPTELNRILSSAVNEWFDAKAIGQREHLKSRRARMSLDDRKFVKEQIVLMAELMTGLWRLRQKLLNPPNGISPDAIEMPANLVGSIWDAFSDAGYRVEETPETFVDSPNLRIVAYEFNPGLTEDRVVEMVKPILYYENTCIQTGEVIIATATQKDIKQ